MRPHLILNLCARRLARGAPVLRALRDAAANRCVVHETQSLHELAGAARSIARAAPRVVLLAGGDGSYMAGITALRDAYEGAPLPAIGFCPGGTVSTVARNHGMHGSIEPYARRVVLAACEAAQRTKEAPTLHVADDAGGDRVGFIFGAGLVARFFEMYEARGARGYGGAARIVARIFASSFVAGKTAHRVLAPMPARLAVDGVPRAATAYSLVCAAAVRDLGLHMRVTYRAGEDPSRVHLVASPLGPRALGPQMPLVLLGRPLLGEGHVDALAREVTLETPAPVPYVLDGDVFTARRITLRAGPLLRLLLA